MAENLATFLAVTGCEDEASAKFFLESANNDVGQAINMYMEQGGAAPIAEGTTASQNAGVEAPEANFSVGMADATPGPEEQRFRAHSKCLTRAKKTSSYFTIIPSLVIAIHRGILSRYLLSSAEHFMCVQVVYRRPCGRQRSRGDRPWAGT
jgi:UBA-like domain